MTNPKDLIVLGRLGKTHGLKGWLRLSSFTAPLEEILDYSQLITKIGGQWCSLKIDQSRQQSNGLLVHVVGYDDPEAAKLLTGLDLSVSKNELPALDADDYYWYQLKGLEVVNKQGELFGKVSRILETGANDVLVVKPNEQSMDDRERLIPYLRDSVIDSVSLAQAKIVVNWDADYLA
ncbi:MAG: ribosome maturation factor RimM [SAR86 cluster bacterium]|uniref:Ribosome maturation factor RimM n=1 Tax=SAR86 cluster bacterium TaxID=2030880 RepID=A0A2A4MK45_9GAMM|nr:MAG: ribosome maturation factor RimM [SAR86 cluster bacterium]